MGDTRSNQPANDPASQGQQSNSQTAPENAQPHQSGVPSQPSPEYTAQAIEAARKQERDKLYATIEHTKQDAKKREEELAAARKRLNELETNADKSLTAEQKIQKQMEALRQDLENERQARRQSEEQANHRLAAAAVEAYRHRRISEEGPALVPEIVGGHSTEEVEASIAMAKAAYAQMRQQVEHEVMAQFQQQGTNGIPSVVQGTPSPHYVPPAGFPSTVNPPPVAQNPDVDLERYRFLTSEQSIRDGTYAKHRNELMDILRSRNPAGLNSVGYGPRYLPAGPAPAPNMQQQFQTAPQGPTRVGQQVMPSPGQSLTPQTPYSASSGPGYAPPAQPHAPAANDPRAEAMASVARMHQGGSPIPGPHQNGARSTVSPEQVMSQFRQQFTPTPPIQERSN